MSLKGIRAHQDEISKIHREGVGGYGGYVPPSRARDDGASPWPFEESSPSGAGRHVRSWRGGRRKDQPTDPGSTAMKTGRTEDAGSTAMELVSAPDTRARKRSGTPSRKKPTRGGPLQEEESEDGSPPGRAGGSRGEEHADPPPPTTVSPRARLLQETPDSHFAQRDKVRRRAEEAEKKASKNRSTVGASAPLVSGGGATVLTSTQQVVLAAPLAPTRERQNEPNAANDVNVASGATLARPIPPRNGLAAGAGAAVAAAASSEHFASRFSLAKLRTDQATQLALTRDVFAAQAASVGKSQNALGGLSGGGRLAGAAGPLALTPSGAASAQKMGTRPAHGGVVPGPGGMMMSKAGAVVGSGPGQARSPIARKQEGKSH